MHSSSKRYQIIIRGELNQLAKDGRQQVSARTSRDYALPQCQAEAIASIDDIPQGLRAPFATIESASVIVTTTESTQLEWKR